MDSSERPHHLDEEALKFHTMGQPGKIAIVPTKPMQTQRDLSLAYSPGVAAPVRAIAQSPDTAFDYTSKGNLVAVISNGTAILGLGNLGALASKPVMEGKAVLFKRFADVDTIDIEVDTTDIEEFIASVRHLGPSFGGINLEDIKGPDCFVIEQRLREIMPIPVFHDDQHGTAIISAAGIVNALHLTNRKIENIRVVVNGAGAAGIACLELLKRMGLPDDHALLCDTKGVIYRGRTQGMNQWKSKHAVETDRRTLADAVKGADVFLGLSVKGALTQEMVATMAKAPIIFAMANPDPEITPEDAKSVRPDAIVATGRSDYPNQVNNVLGFPYIFRGALDVRATAINEEMKIAAVHALAELAREDVPDEVAAAYGGKRPSFGPEYIIPAPFDPRLIARVSSAVAKAAMETGVAKKPIADFGEYRAKLSARLDPSAAFFHKLAARVHADPKTVVFSEGEEEAVVRAAAAFVHAGLGKAVLVGRPEAVRRTVARAAVATEAEFEIRDPASETADRFAAAMLKAGDADAMVTGVTRPFANAFADVRQIVGTAAGRLPIGIQAIVDRARTIFVADTSMHDLPTAEDLAAIATEAAAAVRRFGFTPRVALIASSTFGSPKIEQSERIAKAVRILDGRKIDFEYDGEMTSDVALDADKLSHYPSCRLKGPANVLIMPSVPSAAIAMNLLTAMSRTVIVGPYLVGLEKSVQIVSLGAKMNEIYNAATIAAL